MRLVPVSVVDLRQRLRARECTAAEIACDLLDRLERLAPEIGGVAAVDRDRTLAEAEAADCRLRAGTPRALEGVPFTVKDWLDVEGWPIAGATGTDPGARDRRPSADATAVGRLRAAGAVVLAVTSAMADNAAFGPTRNPRDPSRAPGGSSSGTAAVVAAGVAPLGLGSDSGGSIRLPAAWCGIAGLKPTFGRVPLTGHFPRCGALADGRTVIGPLATSVDDLALTLPFIAGPDGLDAGVMPVPLGEPDAVVVASVRVGCMGQDDTTALGVSALQRAGAITATALPDVRDEAMDITRRYWDRATLSGPENVRLLWDWDRFRRRMLTLTAGVDIVITPATDGTAPSWRESVDTDYQWMLPWSLTGAPVVVVPVSTKDGMPVAVQIVARPWQDHVALAVARSVENAVAFA
jgi:amidase